MMENNENEKSDSIERLISLVRYEVNTGASRNEIIEKLIAVGMNPANIEPFVDALYKEKDKKYDLLGKFLALSIIGCTLWLFFVFYVFEHDILIDIAKYIAISAFSLFVVFILLLKVSGKFITYVRFSLAFVTLLSFATLTGTLFIQEAWNVDPLQVRGGLAALVFLAINFFINIGPFGNGLISAFFTLIALVFAFGESLRIEQDDYEGMD